MVLRTYIEIDGNSVLFGRIEDGRFSYDERYIYDVGLPVSVSLQIREESFTELETYNYFDSLLPEGFTRRSVARYFNTDDSDYLTILAQLGRECIGAVRISADDEQQDEPGYIRISDDEVRRLAAEGQSASVDMITRVHLSLAGASGKAGLYYDNEGGWFMPFGTAPSTHIVKQSHVRLDRIVVNERLSMLTARNMGIDIPGSFVVDTGKGSDDEILFATERYDRSITGSSRTLNGHPVPLRLHQEDMAQAMGIPAAMKYEPEGSHYLSDMARIIERWSQSPAEDLVKLWDRTVFNYLIGNTDGHIKNFSLLYSPDLKKCRLAPAYDIISTGIYPGMSRQMAFSIGGKRDIDEIDRDDFVREAGYIRLGVKNAMRRFDDLSAGFEDALAKANEELKSEGIDSEDIYRRISESKRAGV